MSADALADTIPAAPLVKRCACGRTFTAHEWSLLVFVGRMMDPEESIELRNCPCGSTVAIEVEP